MAPFDQGSLHLLGRLGFKPEGLEPILHGATGKSSALVDGVQLFFGTGVKDKLSILPDNLQAIVLVLDAYEKEWWSTGDSQSAEGKLDVAPMEVTLYALFKSTSFSIFGLPP